MRNDTDRCCVGGCPTLGNITGGGTADLQCEDLQKFGGFLVISLVLISLGLVIIAALQLAIFVKRRLRRKDSVEVINSSTGDWKPDKDAYTMSYDTYPPTYQSHGPQ
eukprot:CAMPEP_0119123080 /NCGR_PEP_ID=MMETSP1310-20130426/3139_1 /TAXON_ID=464262 /ORGANISM="Genus nov. species nov., Strain RCC2339" /LENGTH=106 /DNA_ID=CAMNT_0007112829 /DNA_START=287 /DNA_END=607 /DNA_ORIENTATION=-